jgi:hypothetical protein
MTAPVDRDKEATEADPNPTPRLWLVTGGACAAWAVLVVVLMYALIGPGKLPPQVARQVGEKPWGFLLFILIGVALAAAGVAAVVRGKAYNAVDAPFARDEYTGKSAVLVGLGQCLAGSTLAGACVALLLLV